MSRTSTSTFSQITDNVNPNYKHYTDLRHDGRSAEYAAEKLCRISLPTRWSRKGRRSRIWPMVAELEARCFRIQSGDDQKHRWSIP